MRISEYLKVGKKLKMVLSGAGITQRCMAVKLDLSYSTYSNYENGYSEPPMEVIFKACDALQISVERLPGLTTAATAPQGSQTCPDKKGQPVAHLVPDIYDSRLADSISNWKTML